MKGVWLCRVLVLAALSSQAHAGGLFQRTGLVAGGALAAPGSGVRTTGTALPAMVRVGQRETLTARVWSSKGLGAVIVDFEVNDWRGAKVFEKARVVRLGANRTITVTRSFVPVSSDFAGTYYFNVGVFGSSWKPIYVWNGVSSFQVVGRQPPGLSAAVQVKPRGVNPGQRVSLSALVSIKGPGQAGLLTDIEVYNRGGSKVYQRVMMGVRVSANGTTRVTFVWRVPRRERSGVYTVAVGVFGPHWAPLYAWDGKAATLIVE